MMIYIFLARVLLLLLLLSLSNRWLYSSCGQTNLPSSDPFTPGGTDTPQDRYFWFPFAFP